MTVIDQGKAWLGNTIINYQKTLNNEALFQLGEKIFIDLKKAFVWFIGGKKGTGKSYCCDVVIEEILLKNPQLGIIILDPMGLHFSLKYPNTNTEEYRGWEGRVTPQGFADRVRVLVPIGWKDNYPEGSYDGTVGIRPCDLSLQNWYDCLKIAGSTPQGNAFGLFLEKARKNNPNFTVAQLVQLIDRVVDVKKNPDEAEDDEASEILNEITFRGATIEALQSKIMATTTWGIFSSKSIDIFDVCQAGMATVIDLSWHQIPQEVGALLVGFLAERLFELRKMRSVERMHHEIGQELDYLKSNKELPPPVLVVEEAHNYLGKIKTNTFSVASFKKYILQGRQAGCSLITLTQQPQNIDTSPLSQIDGCIIFSLTHKNDFEAVSNIIPTELPKKWKMDLRGLLNGEAIVAFSGKRTYEKVRVHPRRSIHLARSEVTSIMDTAKTEGNSAQEQLPETDAETETLPEAKPPGIVPPHESVSEIGRLMRENAGLRARFDALKDEKNGNLQQRETQIKELSTKVIDLQRLIESTKNIDKHGIILAKFDEERGTIADYDMSSEKVDEKLLHDIARGALGIGETMSYLNFKLEREQNFYCCSKRFSRPIEDARGGQALYALVVFTTNDSKQVDEKLLMKIVTALMEDWPHHTKTIDRFFSQVFFTSQELQQTLLVYKTTLEDAQRRIQHLVERRTKVETKLKEQIHILEDEKHLLVDQINNMGNIFNLEDPKVQSIVMADKYEELKKLSEELAIVRGQLDEERAKHNQDIDQCERVIVKMDLDLERTATKIEEEIEADTKVEQKLFQVNTQTQAVDVENLATRLEQTGLKPLIEQMLQKERGRFVTQLQSAEDEVQGYREGLTDLKKYILDMKNRHKIKLLEHEARSLEILNYSQKLEKQIDNLKDVVRQLRPQPIETISEDEKIKIFAKEMIPREVVKALNPDTYSKDVVQIAQKLKYNLTKIDPVSYKIMSLLETVDAWVSSNNICLTLIDWSISTIRKRLGELLKKNYIIQQHQGSNILYRSNLKQLVKDTYKPYRALLTGFQIDELYMEIRNSLNIQLIPTVPKTITVNGTTLDPFIEPGSRV
jgi:hypothetical protein